MIEPEPPTIRRRTALIARLREFPALLAEPAFRTFLVVVMLTMMGRMALPFYVIFAASTMTLSGANLGLLSLAFLGADTLSNLLWGYLGDRAGFRLVLLMSLALWIFATLALLGAGNVAMVAAAFAGLGASQAGYQMSSQTMILEFGARDEMPMRVALAATAEGVVAAISPLLGGFISSALGFPTLFSVSIAFLLAALVLLNLVVKEPRARRPAA